jgi:hypothetical protein
VTLSHASLRRTLAPNAPLIRFLQHKSQSVAGGVPGYARKAYDVQNLHGRQFVRQLFPEEFRRLLARFAAVAVFAAAAPGQKRPVHQFTPPETPLIDSVLHVAVGHEDDFNKAAGRTRWDSSSESRSISAPYHVFPFGQQDHRRDQHPTG